MGGKTRKSKNYLEKVRQEGDWAHNDDSHGHKGRGNYLIDCIAKVSVQWSMMGKA